MKSESHLSSAGRPHQNTIVSLRDPDRGVKLVHALLLRSHLFPSRQVAIRVHLANGDRWPNSGGWLRSEKEFGASAGREATQPDVRHESFRQEFA